MKFRILTAIALATLLNAGCASKRAMSNLESGMSISEVKKVLGNPDDRTFRGRREHWIYDNKDKAQRKVVIFEDGKVVELLNAGQTEGYFKVSSKDLDLDKAKKCAGKNRYGKFAEGGGCNMYGCYPPGGYCNQYGCTRSGRCIRSGCPDKLESYVCVD